MTEISRENVDFLVIEYKANNIDERPSYPEGYFVNYLSIKVNDDGSYLATALLSKHKFEF